MERVAAQTLDRMGLIDWKLEVLASFLRVKSK